MSLEEMLPWIWDYLVLGCLTNWIRDYRKNGYNVIDKPIGRPRKKTITKRNQKKIKPEDKKIKELEEELLYPRVENAYLKGFYTFGY